MLAALIYYKLFHHFTLSKMSLKKAKNDFLKSSEKLSVPPFEDDTNFFYLNSSIEIVFAISKSANFSKIVLK